MKPTRVFYPHGSTNQIPGQATIQGDVRMTPFYNLDEAMKEIEGWVAELNADISKLPVLAPFFQNTLEDATGRLEFKWIEEPFYGVACDIHSDGYKVLEKATTQIVGSCVATSTCGALPLVDKLLLDGYDVQIAGYGVEEVYHAANEYCNLSDMVQGFDIFCMMISELK